MRYCSSNLLILVATVVPSVCAAEQERFFENEVRPLLVRRCQECHGADKQQGGLRLDSREALLHGVEGDPVVVAGEPEKSRLIQVIEYADDDTQMPPDGKLPESEIAVLTKWIAEGAYWPGSPETPAPALASYPRTPDGEIDFAAAAEGHWAYQPVHKPPVPDVGDQERATSPIDRFIIARLESVGLSMSRQAEPRTLVRRLTFDLHGLPPAYANVRAFADDPSASAYARLIDRLLASPLYGQRWGRHWLDVARYADTKGYVFTQDPKYPYAYTYRDYVIDALNSDKPFDRFVVEQLAADRLGLQENDPALAALGFLTVGPRFRGNPHDIIDDRIDVVTRGLMGMTLACARCHDHKYDPIPTADYYSIYGVFNSTIEPDDLPVVGEPEDTPEYRAYREELARREQAVDEYLRTTHSELLQQAREHLGDYLLAVVREAGKVPPGIEVTFEHGRPRDNLTKLWTLFIAQRVKANDPVFLPWGAFAGLPVEDFQSKAGELIARYASASDDPPPVNARIWSALQETPPQSMVDVARVYARVLKSADEDWRALVAAAGEDLPAGLVDEEAEQLRRVLTGAGSLTDMPVDERLFERDHRDQLTKLRRKVDEWHAASPGAPPRAMVLRDKDQPVQPVVFLRGTPGRNGDHVPRRFPRIVAGADSPEFHDGSGRLGLAQGIVSADNPLTARVIVNRVWMHHFGAPLVATPSDFGTRSDPPSHPALLDWLAASLIENGWSLKWLHREILLSRTYQQASKDRPDARSVDPENRLLWRMNRQRLEFEPMRDSMLAVAGRLDPALSGRSIDIEKDPETGRRSVYAFIDRNNFSSLLRTFDFPSPDAHSAGRPMTSVPQQTLYAMNAGFPQQMARHVVERPAVRNAPSPEQQVQALYRIILSRDPTADEQSLATGFLTAPDKLPQLAQALLLTNEFLFID